MEVQITHDYWRVETFQGKPPQYCNSGKELLELFLDKTVRDLDDQLVGKVEDVLLNADTLFPSYLSIISRHHFVRTDRHYYPIDAVADVTDTEVFLKHCKSDLKSNLTFDPSYVEEIEDCGLASLQEKVRDDTEWPCRRQVLFEERTAADPFWQGMFW